MNQSKKKKASKAYVKNTVSTSVKKQPTISEPDSSNHQKSHFGSFDHEPSGFDWLALVKKSL